jgi:hypothetical protein
LGTTESSWTTLNGHEVVCNNSASGTIDCATIGFANRAMLHTLWLLKQNYINKTEANTQKAQNCFARAMTFWDGKGFNDAVGPVHYDSYKTALGLYCANFSELEPVINATPLTLRSDLFDTIQGPNGGIYGRYEYDSGTDSITVSGTFENTEATSLFIMAQQEKC